MPRQHEPLPHAWPKGQPPHPQARCCSPRPSPPVRARDSPAEPLTRFPEGPASTAGGLCALLTSPQSTSKLLFQTITCQDQQAQSQGKETSSSPVLLHGENGPRGLSQSSGPGAGPWPHLIPTSLQRRLFGTGLEKMWLRHQDAPSCVPLPGLCTCWSPASVSQAPGSTSPEAFPPSSFVTESVLGHAHHLSSH